MKLKLHWLLLSVLSTILFSLPAQAARLLFWRYDSNQNQLAFTTDSGVQPRAVLLSNPTRLVIDLPGTSLGRPTVNQALGGTIRELRVGQFDSQTTRLVIELAPGYTLNPEQIRVRGTSPTQWLVELPQPQQAPPQQQSSLTPAPAPSAPLPSQSSAPTPTPGGSSLSDFQVTRNGFFLRLDSNQQGRITVSRSRDRRRIDFDLQGINFPQRLIAQAVAVNQFGVNQVEFSQTTPGNARVSMNVTPESPDWQASYSRTGGLVFVPRGALPVAFAQTPSPNPTPSPNTLLVNRRRSEIQTIEFLGNSQLVIRANQAIRASSRWDPRAGVYQITIPNAQLADNVQGPQLARGSSISRLSIRQQDEDTVVILLQPSSGVQLGELNQVNEQLVALQILSAQAQNPAPAPSSGISIPVTPPPPETRTPTPAMPSVPTNRLRVVIDAGHGGRDPGAVGIGGIQEKNIVLPISLQVAQILEQQGVQAVLTRSDDTFVSLEGRVQRGRQTQADLFVSIHANAISMSRPDVNGLETYYFSSGRGLAQSIHNSILQRVNIRDRGVRQARFYVLRQSPMPAVLVEVGFVTGQEDAARLATAAHRQQMAEAIAAGILQYIRQNLI